MRSSGIAIGSESITSATRRCSIREVTSVWTVAERADEPMMKPIRASQMPLISWSSIVSAMKRPKPMKR